MPSTTSDSEDDTFQSHYRSASSSSSSPSPSPPPTPQHNFFAPPFYNRPPTPLPPSPSLTSLLRPSRPTTPDTSADELDAPVPRASPKVPTYEYYGFVLYLFSSLTFLVYILWSYLPSPFLHALGIYYYPNRWWSVAIPSWIVVLLVYIYVALQSYNVGYLTLPLGSVETVVDEAANIATIDGRRNENSGGNGGHGGREKGKDSGSGSGSKGRDGRREKTINDWGEIWSTGTDAVMDVPLGGVCEVLYGEFREEREEEEE